LRFGSLLRRGHSDTYRIDLYIIAVYKNTLPSKWPPAAAPRRCHQLPCHPNRELPSFWGKGRIYSSEPMRCTPPGRVGQWLRDTGVEHTGRADMAPLASTPSLRSPCPMTVAHPTQTYASAVTAIPSAPSKAGRWRDMLRRHGKF